MSTILYSTSTGTGSSYGELTEELAEQVQLFSENYRTDFDEADLYDSWCYVCSRPTDHRGEHDDLVVEGRARYDERFEIVYSY